MLFEKIFSSISTILRPSYSEVQNDNVTTKIIDKIFECYYFNNFTNVILLEYNLDQYNSDKITKNLAIIPYNITILDKSYLEERDKIKSVIDTYEIYKKELNILYWTYRIIIETIFYFCDEVKIEKFKFI